MCGIVFGAITPHGFSIIDDIAGSETALFKPIREGMEAFGRRINQYDLDTIIILTPHGLSITGHNAIYTTQSCRGTLSQFGNSVSLDYLCDQEMAQAIYKRSKETKIPVVACNFGAMNGDVSNIPMDWGTLIPLWFVEKKNEKKPKIVVIGPTRETSYDSLIHLGEVIALVAKESNKKVALIASADQGHCHQESGPYGYATESKMIDDLIIDIVKKDQLERLCQISKDLIEKGKPDSLWQMLILYGALTHTPLKSTFMTYSCPTYFGMLVATYEEWYCEK